MIHRIVKHAKNSAALVAAEKTGKAITGLIPKTVELHQMRTPVRRIMILSIELLVGLLVIGAFLLGLFYYRLEKGAIDLNFVVPSIESAINDQLTDLSVKIESAFVGKNKHDAGVHFRLRNIILYNKTGEAIANAPLAAVDLNGRALLWGRIAPSQVVFIQPTLDIVYNENSGLSLSYARSNGSTDSIADLLSGMGSSSSSAEFTPRVVEKIEFMKAVTAAFEEARSHRNTTSYLTQFGVRDATVNFSRGKSRSSWKMPDFIIDLKHSDNGSLIRGFGKLGLSSKAEAIKPWKLRFQTQQYDKTKDLQLDVGFDNITPTSLHQLLPDIEQLKMFNIPISGKVNAKFNEKGDLKSAFANIHLAAGQIIAPWLSVEEDGIEGIDLKLGEVKMAYSAKTKKLHILPSPFKWGNNTTILSGVVEQDMTNSSSKLWKFTFKGSETRLSAGEFNLGPMIIDEWWIAGSIAPEQNKVDIYGFFVRAGNATINLKGTISDLDSSPGLFLKGKLSSISLPVLKRLWPGLLAVSARNWVGESITEGQIVGGSFKIAIPSGTLADFPDKGDLTPDMVDLKLDLADLVVNYAPDLIPIKISNASVKLAGRQLSVDMPKGRLRFQSGAPLKLSHGSFTISDMRKKEPESDLSFRIAGNVQSFLKFIEQPSLNISPKTGFDPSQIKGKLKGVISMHIPLKKKLTFKDIALNGNLRLRDMRSEKLFGDVSIDAGTINIKLSEKAVGADGGIVIKGIPVKLNWQHIFSASASKQPPVRLSAVMNMSSRAKVGLGAMNDYLKGDVPVVLTIAPEGKGSKTIQVRADLTSSLIYKTPIGWSKPPGTAAVMQFDIDTRKSETLVLRDFSLVGNQLVLEGDIHLHGNTNNLKSFSFPMLSFQDVKSMSLSGKRNDSGVLEINAHVGSLDGRKVLRNRLFGKNTGTKHGKSSKTHTDYDFIANIDSIHGSKGTFISGAKLVLKQRDGKLTWLNFNGRLNGQTPIATLLEKNKSGRRILKAESADAGATFRMIGLFPSIQGGQLSLIVDMDQKGTSEKRGTLWVKNFFVTSSQTISNDVNPSDIFKNEFIGSTLSRKSRRSGKTIQTKMQFDQLKAPFSYGDGQFILRDSYVNGPVIGATLRGKIDFRTEQMRLGGTYIPLYGLNSAIGEIPILSDLLVGRQGEGVFGVTFAIEGPTARPTVIVNPVSLLTPGVFRQIFDFNNTVKDRQFRKLPKAHKKYRQKRSGNGRSTLR